MPQPPITTYIAHETIKALPFAAQKAFNNATLAIGGTFVVEFDVAEKITDPNAFLVGAFPGVANPQVAIGPNLDALFFSTQAGRIDVEYAVDLSCAYHVLFTTIVGANVPGNISGLRITGRFVRVTYTNTSGIISASELGVYVRST
jgi:hypothetical protein